MRGFQTCGRDVNALTGFMPGISSSITPDAANVITGSATAQAVQKAVIDFLLLFMMFSISRVSGHKNAAFTKNLQENNVERDVDSSRRPRSCPVEQGRSTNKKGKHTMNKLIMQIMTAAMLAVGGATAYAAPSDNGQGRQPDTAEVRQGEGTGGKQGARKGKTRGKRQGAKHGARNGLKQGLKYGLKNGLKNGEKK